MARKRDVSKAVKSEMNEARYGPPAPKGKPTFPMKGKKKPC